VVNASASNTCCLALLNELKAGTNPCHGRIKFPLANRHISRPLRHDQSVQLLISTED
jgi:hypothetical protein